MTPLLVSFTVNPSASLFSQQARMVRQSESVRRFAL